MTNFSAFGVRAAQNATEGPKKALAFGDRLSPGLGRSLAAAEGVPFFSLILENREKWISNIHFSLFS